VRAEVAAICRNCGRSGALGVPGAATICEARFFSLTFLTISKAVFLSAASFFSASSTLWTLFIFSAGGSIDSAGASAGMPQSPVTKPLQHMPQASVMCCINWPVVIQLAPVAGFQLSLSLSTILKSPSAAR
jgi:hypothetical protein